MYHEIDMIKSWLLRFVHLIYSYIHTSPIVSASKVCNENIKTFIMDRGLYKAVYQKAGSIDFNELQVANSTYKEGTNS